MLGKKANSWKKKAQQMHCEMSNELQQALNNVRDSCLPSSPEGMQVMASVAVAINDGWGSIADKDRDMTAKVNLFFTNAAQGAVLDEIEHEIVSKLSTKIFSEITKKDSRFGFIFEKIRANKKHAEELINSGCDVWETVAFQSSELRDSTHKQIEAWEHQIFEKVQSAVKSSNKIKELARFADDGIQKDLVERVDRIVSKTVDKVMEKLKYLLDTDDKIKSTADYAEKEENAEKERREKYYKEKLKRLPAPISKLLTKESDFTVVEATQWISEKATGHQVNDAIS